MNEEPQAPEVKFSNIKIDRVVNGFILELDKRSCSPCDVYVFNTLEQLSEFIKDLK